jgi:polysaccharide deacetylase family protein (PEP-CTERM system associated)
MNSMVQKPVFHVMSVDVEDYFQTEAFSSVVSRDQWNDYPLRVEKNVHRILNMFDEHDVEATFFFLGWIADRMPWLVREVADRGHEIACHSYWHHPIYKMSQEEFRIDTRMAVRAIENATGTPVVGYRAPTWSITKNSLWAIRVLMEEGFLYDSSIYPVRHDLYGIPGAERTPYMWRGDKSALAELPPATVCVGKLVLPAAGGGYLRIFPLAYTRAALEIAERSGESAVIYFHPWEIDPEQPRLDGGWKANIRQYACLGTMEKHLTGILERYRFTAFRNVWQQRTVFCSSVAAEASGHQDAIYQEQNLAGQGAGGRNARIS